MRETIEAAPTMRLTFDNDWHATVTADPLPIIPRFSGNSVDTAHYADVKERERFLLATFGSQERLWETPDVLRFDPDSRRLAGAEFQLPGSPLPPRIPPAFQSCPRYARVGSARTRSGTSGWRCARCCAALPRTPC